MEMTSRPLKKSFAFADEAWIVGLMDEDVADEAAGCNRGGETLSRRDAGVGTIACSLNREHPTLSPAGKWLLRSTAHTL
jgi:hypothetical protein